MTQDHGDGGEEHPAPETAAARRSWYIGVGIALGVALGVAFGAGFTDRKVGDDTVDDDPDDAQPKG